MAEPGRQANRDFQAAVRSASCSQPSEVQNPCKGGARLCAAKSAYGVVHRDDWHRAGGNEDHAGQSGLQYAVPDLSRTPACHRIVASKITDRKPKQRCYTDIQPKYFNPARQPRTSKPQTQNRRLMKVRTLSQNTTISVFSGIYFDCGSTFGNIYILLVEFVIHVVTYSYSDKNRIFENLGILDSLNA